MKTKIVKVIQILFVAASMVAGFLFYQRFSPEAFLMPKEEIIGEAQIQADPSESYTGKTAGEGIPHLSGIAEYDQLGTYDYVSVTTDEIISTDVYGLKPWVDPYSLTRMRLSGGHTVSTGRRAPEVREGLAVRAEAYQEYYLIRLPAAGYCLAQFSEACVRQLNQEGEVTLPIGKKQTTSKEARKYLEDMGNAYEADTSYVLYMVDDDWGEENHFRLFLIRFGASVGVFLVLAVALLLLLEKIVMHR